MNEPLTIGTPTIEDLLREVEQLKFENLTLKLECEKLKETIVIVSKVVPGYSPCVQGMQSTMLSLEIQLQAMRPRYEAMENQNIRMKTFAIEQQNKIVHLENMILEMMSKKKRGKKPKGGEVVVTEIEDKGKEKVVVIELDNKK